MWMRQTGGSFVTADGKKLGFTKKDLNDYWSYWDDLKKAGVLPSGKISSEQVTSPKQGTFFGTGKAIMIDRPMNQAKVYAKYVKGNQVDLMRVPLSEELDAIVVVTKTIFGVI